MSEAAAHLEVRTSRPERGVAMIRIDRPERRNALDMRVKTLIADALAEAEADVEVSSIVITGGDSMFVAGTDVAEMAGMAAADHARLGTNAMFLALRASSKPILAAVEGYALGGGCELAMACDMVFSARDARFGQPEIRVGVMPGAGGTQWLPRLAGRHRALYLLLTGQPFSAAEAHAMGLVSELTEPGEATSRAIEAARTIAGMPPLAVRAIREAVARGFEDGVSAGLAHERILFEALFDTIDQKEGMAAFLEKRPPRYSGA